MSFIDIYAAAPKPPAWVIPGILPEGLTFIAGPPKTSMKSTFVAALACAIAGFEVPGLPESWRRTERRGNVVLLSAEADAGEIRQMLDDGLRVAGKEGYIYVDDDPFSFPLEKPASAFSDTDEGHPSPTMLVVDPLANFHDEDENSPRAMLKILRPLSSWAKSNAAAVVVVHHTTKEPKDREETNEYMQADLRGSGAMFGFADGLIVITPSEMSRLEKMVPGKLILRGTMKRGASFRTVIDTPAWKSPAPQGRLTELERQIVALKGKTAEEIAALLKRETVTVRAACLNLLKRGLL